MSYFNIPYHAVSASGFCIDALNAYIAKSGQPSIIVLCGDVGTGKTWDACALSANVIRKSGNRTFCACSSLHEHDSDTMGNLLGVRCLVLDDYGARQTQGALTRAFDLVNARMHDPRLATIITTNLIADVRKIDERMASRLNTACVINYSGMPDRRLK